MTLRTLSTALIALALALPAGAADFAVDTVHSSVGFKVSHMVVAKTRGSFPAFTGTIRLDEQDLAKSSVEVSIDVTSIDTANEDRDKHLRSADFFDVDQHPTMSFKSTRVEKKGDGFVAHGELTMKGVTKPVALPFTLSGPIDDPWGNRRLGVSVEPVVLNRQDFGLTWSKAMEAGGLMVGNEVTVEIELEAIEAKPAAPAAAATS